MAFSTMPPVVPLSGLGLVCFFTRLMPSTMTFSSSFRSTTRPRLPLSLPASTMTSSPLRILFMAGSLQDFRGQGHDLHELLGAQFARDRSEDAGADGLQLVIEQHGGIAVELDEGAIATADALGGADHHGAVDLALLDAATGRGFLDGHLDDVANTGVTPLGATEHLDAQDGLRAGVVGDFEPRFSLDHFSYSQLVPNAPCRTIRQDIGAVLGPPSPGSFAGRHASFGQISPPKRRARDYDRFAGFVKWGRSNRECGVGRRQLPEGRQL